MKWSTTRQSFYADSQVCRAQCDSETRLYHMPTEGAVIEDARDQSGLAYSGLDTAFIYRKKRVAGCTCKAPPWSAREQQRHRDYAEAAARDAEAKAKAVAQSAAAQDAGTDQQAEAATEPTPGAVVVAGRYPSEPSSNDRGAPSFSVVAGTLFAGSAVDLDMPMSAPSASAAANFRGSVTAGAMVSQPSASVPSSENSVTEGSSEWTGDGKAPREPAHESIVEPPRRTRAEPTSGRAEVPRRSRPVVYRPVRSASSAQAAPTQPKGGYVWPGDQPSRRQ